MAALGSVTTAVRTPQPLCQSRKVSSIDMRWAYSATACATVGAVVNGGWKKWFAEGRPVSIDSPRPAAATFTPRPHPDVLCTLDYGRANVGNADVVFLDVRSDGEWDGSNNRGNKRAGRIPGAVHLEWLNFVTADAYQTIKPAHELRAMLEAVGATPDKDIVTY
jgi:thiosulfate/3-mercaptopyruvate sulfurtransferase